MPGFRDLFHVVEEVFLVKWQARWREEVKGRFFYKFQPRVSLKVSFSDKDRAKQMVITTNLKFGKYLLNDVLKLMGKHPDGRYDFCVASNVEEEKKEDAKHYLMDLWSISI